MGLGNKPSGGCLRYVMPNSRDWMYILKLLLVMWSTPNTLDTEMIEEKIGEVLGLEMAAQKAVDQLVSKGYNLFYYDCSR